MPATRALLFGNNYPGTDAALNGCVNDAENLAEYLVASGFAAQADVKIMCEATGWGMIRALVALAAETNRQVIDTVFVSYSGHGTHVADDNGDETDGRDECLCPSDFETMGVLPDDFLNDLIEIINPRTRVVLLMDCCHSGSCMDLPMRYLTKTRFVRDASAAAKCHPNVIMLSGCMDSQTSADAFDASRAEFTGAMTSAFLDSVKAKPAVVKDAFDLLTAMRALLKKRKMTQVPQMSTSMPIPKTGQPPLAFL